MDEDLTMHPLCVEGVHLWFRGFIIGYYISLEFSGQVWYYILATQIQYFHLASVHFCFGKNAGSVFVRLQRGNEFVSQQ